VSEATVEQITSKARTEFCAKHQSFADFCFVHHKTEPLIPATKLTSYDAISEVDTILFRLTVDMISSW